MTLKDRIDRELNRLATSGANGGTLHMTTDAGRLDSELRQVDSIGCAFLRLALQTDRLADATMNQLKKLSEALSARLSYLLEPISPIEVDVESCTVQMRSAPPHQDDDGTSYYELLVRRGGDLSLCRYSKTAASGRQVIPAHVTREVFQRLAADFESAVT